MKAWITYIVLVLVAISLLACKKNKTEDNNNPDPNPFEEIEARIRHKWVFDWTALNIYIPTPDADTVYGIPGDYYEFKTDELLYTYWGNVHDTIPYRIIASNRIVLGGDTLAITTFSAGQLILTRTTLTDTTHYDNVIHLSR